ncbi:MAG: hypothetical protein LH479_10265, partial [Polaromonas sp.]|nr:hypothetical protein [Polaromonas sp.]
IQLAPGDENPVGQRALPPGFGMALQRAQGVDRVDRIDQRLASPVVSIITRLKSGLMTSLHRRIVEKQLQVLGGQRLCEGEIDSVDSIRELVIHGRWATVRPVSLFKELRAETVTMSEISGMQLHRMLVLAMRIERQPAQGLQLMGEMIEAEFARLADRGVLAFGAQAAELRCPYRTVLHRPATSRTDLRR